MEYFRLVFLPCLTFYRLADRIISDLTNLEVWIIEIDWILAVSQRQKLHNIVYLRAFLTKIIII